MFRLLKKNVARAEENFLRLVDLVGLVDAIEAWIAVVPTAVVERVVIPLLSRLPSWSVFSVAAKHWLPIALRRAAAEVLFGREQWIEKRRWIGDDKDKEDRVTRWRDRLDIVLLMWFWLPDRRQELLQCVCVRPEAAFDLVCDYGHGDDHLPFYGWADGDSFKADGITAEKVYQTEFWQQAMIAAAESVSSPDAASSVLLARGNGYLPPELRRRLLDLVAGAIASATDVNAFPLQPDTSWAKRGVLPPELEETATARRSTIFASVLAEVEKRTDEELMKLLADERLGVEGRKIVVGELVRRAAASSSCADWSTRESMLCSKKIPADVCPSHDDIKAVRCVVHQRLVAQHQKVFGDIEPATIAFDTIKWLEELEWLAGRADSFYELLCQVGSPLWHKEDTGDSYCKLTSAGAAVVRHAWSWIDVSAEEAERRCDARQWEDDHMQPSARQLLFHLCRHCCRLSALKALKGKVTERLVEWVSYTLRSPARVEVIKHLVGWLTVRGWEGTDDEGLRKAIITLLREAAPHLMPPVE